jgi:putative spermidine/putrescine transport system substrate-binding protein
MNGKITRRRLLSLGAGLTATSVFAPSILRAQETSGTCVVSAWGGDYSNLLTKNIEEPLLRPKGINIVQDTGDEPIRMAKLVAQRRLPRGNVDVICVQAPTDFELHQSDLLEPLDESKIPNLKYVQSDLANPYAIPHICSPQVIAYSTERVKEPPTTFSDLEDPRYAGKIGLLDASELWIAMAAALKKEGDPGKILEMKPVLEKLVRGGAKTLSTTEAFAPAMKSGEIDVGLVWHARVLSWSKGGVAMASSFPVEGCMTYVVSMCVLKNAPNKAAAFAYLNAALDPAAQRGFARDMGYNPTITNAQLEGDVAKRLALPVPPPRLIPAPSAQLSAVNNEMSDWWRRLLQRP